MRGGVLIGREAERTWLEEGVADALAGRGALVLLAGEAGIGKTRLADEVAEESDALALRGAASPAATLPYGPMLGALRGYLAASRARWPRAARSRAPRATAAAYRTARRLGACWPRAPPRRPRAWASRSSAASGAVRPARTTAPVSRAARSRSCACSPSGARTARSRASPS
jgi:hypothetical protein